MLTKHTIVITGVSSGFGRALAEQALQAGHRVIGTVRSQADKVAFEQLNSHHAIGRILDVTNHQDVNKVITDIETNIAPIDVLVNNAGYGHEGLLEESSMEEIRSQFEVNVFGAIALMKSVVPYMRQRRAGKILNITSMGGYITMPGISDYCGSKFALVGISDALAKELKPFDISVISVAPGSFRTDWAGRSMVRTPRTISDYDQSFDPIRKAREDKNGKQLGDPIKAAQAMLEVIDSAHPPSHLLLGSDALSLVRTQLAEMNQSIDTWQALTCSTDG
ncbi:Short-chain dehydrogenase [Vibrio xiamenensis]|uniref:Short-chain dehydrogenase n=1 Tax=Vibrio xiamenensis TaxID=861298 RepID=A0A1G8GEV4_9VIBR|nr:oxidoreductase [Vibrio xiamenensis]SDH92817.1 Short-chain dehydrogenase [Vibrio xiamenensis]